MPPTLKQVQRNENGSDKYDLCLLAKFKAEFVDPFSDPSIENQ